MKNLEINIDKGYFKVTSFGSEQPNAKSVHGKKIYRSRIKETCRDNVVLPRFSKFKD